MYRLENWYVVNVNPSVAWSVEPETQECRIVGNVFNNTDYDDGEVITTSYIVDKKDGVVTTVSESKYLLGEVDLAYENAFPNARARFFSVCKEEDKAEDKTLFAKFLETKLREYWNTTSGLTVAGEAWNASRLQTRDEICELIHKLAKRHEPFTPFIITAEINRKIKHDN